MVYRWSATYTTHGCNVDGYYLCHGVECGDGDDRFNGVCDKNGCEFGSNLLNDRFFYGANDSYTVDSRKPFTIVTQFFTADGTDSGDLSEINRYYVQDGQVINNAGKTCVFILIPHRCMQVIENVDIKIKISIESVFF